MLWPISNWLLQNLKASTVFWGVFLTIRTLPCYKSTMVLNTKAQLEVLNIWSMCSSCQLQPDKCQRWCYMEFSFGKSSFTKPHQIYRTAVDVLMLVSSGLFLVVHICLCLNVLASKFYFVFLSFLRWQIRAFWHFLLLSDIWAPTLTHINSVDKPLLILSRYRRLLTNRFFFSVGCCSHCSLPPKGRIT